MLETRPRPPRTTHSGQKGQVTNVGPQRRPRPRARWYETRAAAGCCGEDVGPGLVLAPAAPLMCTLGSSQDAQGLGPCLLHGEPREAPGPWLQPGQLCLGWTFEDWINEWEIKAKKPNQPAKATHTPPPRSGAESCQPSPRHPRGCREALAWIQVQTQRKRLPPPLGSFATCALGSWPRVAENPLGCCSLTRTEPDCWAQTPCAKQKPPESACASAQPATHHM